MLVASLVVLALTAPAGGVVGEHAADRARIARHLHAVEADLRARDVGDLSAALREQRLANLERLRTYAAAGEFPHNEDFAGDRVPYFVDADGVPCAVGFLVIDSGFADVAQQIRDSENNARLLAMTHPALPTWIAASGLTAAECARIQPSYCDCGEQYAPVCGVDGITYTNECVAEKCAGVEVAHDGACKGEETTGWPNPGTEADPGTSTSDTDASTGNTDANTTDASTGTGSSSGAAESTGVDSSGPVITGAAASSSGVNEDDGPATSEATDTDDPGVDTTKPGGCQGCRLTDEGSPPLLALLALLGIAAPRRRR